MCSDGYSNIPSNETIPKDLDAWFNFHPDGYDADPEDTPPKPCDVHPELDECWVEDYIKKDSIRFHDPNCDIDG